MCGAARHIKPIQLSSLWPKFCNGASAAQKYIISAARRSDRYLQGGVASYRAVTPPRLHNDSRDRWLVAR